MVLQVVECDMDAQLVIIGEMRLEREGPNALHPGIDAVDADIGADIPKGFPRCEPVDPLDRLRLLLHQRLVPPSGRAPKIPDIVVPGAQQPDRTGFETMTFGAHDALSR
ncbi:hypothetical protein [Sphingomonas sp.]|uniref:hypothetical protein n=1 Tax=Sphingomonas sp. TaxID=28214 RepID=UPI002ED78AC8